MRIRQVAIALASASAAATAVVVPTGPAALASAPPCAAAAWTTGTHLRVAEVGTEMRSLYQMASALHSPPRWDATGSYLSVVTRSLASSAELVVIVFDRDGTQLAVIPDANSAATPYEPISEVVAPFAPDGRISWVGGGMLELRTWPEVVATSIALPTTGEAALAWSPDGAHLAWTATAPGSERQVWVADADGTDPHPVGDAADPITQLRWSDAATVSWNAEGTGHSVDSATDSAVAALVGPPAWTSPAGTVLTDGSLDDVAWSDDDRLIASLDNFRFTERSSGSVTAFLASLLLIRTTDRRWGILDGDLLGEPEPDEFFPALWPIKRVVMFPGVATADVRLEVSDVVVDGQRTSMHVVVTNDGPCTAPDVTLPVPDLGRIYAIHTSAVDPNPLTAAAPGVEGAQLRLGDLASGDTRTFELAIDVAAPATPAAAFIALDSPIADPTPGDVIAQIEASPAHLLANFPDVEPTSPFTTPIAWAAHHAVTGGYADGGFHPGAPVTRQAIAAMVWRLRGSPQGPFSDPDLTAPFSDDEPELAAPFSDVDLDHRFVTAIDWARWAELTAGYSDGGFHPTATVTRQSLVTMLWRLAGEPTGAPDPAYSDVPVGHPFRDAIGWATDVGITTGYADGTFRPAGTVTRQAAAAWLTRWHDAAS